MDKLTQIGLPPSRGSLASLQLHRRGKKLCIGVIPGEMEWMHWQFGPIRLIRISYYGIFALTERRLWAGQPKTRGYCQGSLLSLLSCPKNWLLDLLWVTNLIPLPGQNDLLQPIAKRQEKGAGKTKPRHLHSQKRVPRNSEGSAQIEEKSKGRYLIYDTIFFERAGGIPVALFIHS